jgi:hypothetical protein
MPVLSQWRTEFFIAAADLPRAIAAIERAEGAAEETLITHKDAATAMRVLRPEFDASENLVGLTLPSDDTAFAYILEAVAPFVRRGSLIIFEDALWGPSIFEFDGKDCTERDLK